MLATNGETLWIAAGLYPPDEAEAGEAVVANDSIYSMFDLPAGVSLYGGFSGSETHLDQRDYDNNLTLLTGDLDQNDSTNALGLVASTSANSFVGSNALFVVRAISAGDAILLDGLSITAGYASGDGDNRNGDDRNGAAIYGNSGASLVVNNCNIQGNWSEYTGGALLGANSATYSISNCVFSYNRGGRGGCIGLLGGNAEIYDCDFSLNYGNAAGGVLFGEGGDTTVWHSRFAGNFSNSKGGVAHQQGTKQMRFVNCEMSGNLAIGHGGVMSGYASFVNCTMAGNRVFGKGGALYLSGAVTSHVANCVIYDNLSNSGSSDASDSADGENGGVHEFWYSLVQHSGGSGSWDTNVGVNLGMNLDVDPRFEEAIDPTTTPTTNGDVRVVAGSYAVNAGRGDADLDGPHFALTQTVVDVSFDLEGDVRVQHGAVDMGAYEATIGIISLNLTNNPQNVTYDVTSATIGGTASDSVYGLLAWSNTLTGASAAIDAAANWSFSLPLDVGVNAYKIFFSNAVGNVANLNASVTRGGIDTGTPIIWITSLATSVDFVTTNYTISGSNNASVVGTMYWTNSLSGHVGSFAAVTPWAVSNLYLATGSNTVTVWGTNALGSVASDSVTLTRLAGAGIATYFVDASTPAIAQNQDGLSWPTAFASLQDALAIVSTQTIWIAEGRYYPDESLAGLASVTNNDRYATFAIPSGVHLYGGFSGGESNLLSRDADVNFCRLSGDIDQDDSTAGKTGPIGANWVLVNNESNSYRVVTLEENGSGIVLDGLRILGGNANEPGIGAGLIEDGGGVYGRKVSATLTDCHFYGNEATEEGGALHLSENSVIFDCVFEFNSAGTGGGANLEFATFDVTDCVFYRNRTEGTGGFAPTSGGDGGGLNMNNTTRWETSTITRCLFERNQSEADGAGAWISESEVIVSQCSVIENEADGDGGGLVFDLTYASLENSRVTGNLGSFGGAIYISSNARLTLLNSTLSGNAGTADGGGIYNDGEALTIRNSIIWNNATGGETTEEAASITNAPGGTVVISHSLIEHSGGSLAWNASLGTDEGGNSDANPLFDTDFNPLNAPSDSGNVRLRSGSPALNLGSNDLVVAAQDLDGQTRIVGARVDLGAYELQSGGVDGAIIYVDDTAVGLNNGASWSNAFNDLQDALAVVTTQQIWIAEGLYFPDEASAGWGIVSEDDRFATFVLPDAVEIYGGFAGHEQGVIHRDIATRNCVLSGDLTQDDATNAWGVLEDASRSANFGAGNNSYTVVDGSQSVTGGRLDGVTVTAGYASENSSSSAGYGGGLYSEPGRLSIIGVTFAGNRARNQGGAMYNGSGSRTVVSNCAFYGNYASGQAGAIQNWQSVLVFTSCLISNNSASGTAGAIYNDDSDVTFEHCAIVDNGAENAGATYDTHSNATRYENCLIAGNASGFSGGAMDIRGDISLVGCTIVENNCSIDPGGAIYNRANPSLINCLIDNNADVSGTDTLSSSITNVGAAAAQFSFSFVRGSGGSAFWNGAAGTDAGGNLDGIVLFVDRVGPTSASRLDGDYHLAYGAVAIDAGTNAASTLSTDLSGNARVFSNRVDLGCYEWTDSDGDGLSDYEETTVYGGYVNDANSDDDAFDDFQESIAGTSPTNANSGLAITGVVSSVSGPVLSWPSVEGRFYRVYCSTNLLEASDWAQVYSQSDTAPANVFTNITATNVAAYYRLSVELD